MYVGASIILFKRKFLFHWKPEGDHHACLGQLLLHHRWKFHTICLLTFLIQCSWCCQRTALISQMADLSRTADMLVRQGINGSSSSGICPCASCFPRGCCYLLWDLGRSEWIKWDVNVTGKAGLEQLSEENCWCGTTHPVAPRSEWLDYRKKQLCPVSISGTNNSSW